MPAKKLSSTGGATAAPATAPTVSAAKSRKRSSAGLGSTTSSADATPLLVAAAVPLRKASLKPRATIVSTPLAVQHAPAPTPTAAPATRTATGSAHASHPASTSSSAPPPAPVATAQNSSSASLRTHATGVSNTKPVTSTRPRASVSSVATFATTPTPGPAADAAANTSGTQAAHTSTTVGSAPAIGTAVRRPRASVKGPSEDGSGAATTSSTAGPAPAPSTATTTTTATAIVPPLRTATRVSAGASASTSSPPLQHQQQLSAVPATAHVVDQPHVAPIASHSGARSRRPGTALTADRATATAAPARTAAAASPPPPQTTIRSNADAHAEAKTSEHQSHSAVSAITAPPTARQRSAINTTSAAPLTAAYTVPVSATSTAATTNAAKTRATDAAATLTEEAELAAAKSAAKKKMVRRVSLDKTAPSSRLRPPNTLASRRSSIQASASGLATATNSAPPTRDPSAAPPPPSGSRNSTAILSTRDTPNATTASELDSAPSTALNTARDSLDGHVIPTLSRVPRRSHGPVVTEEWTRSIIKPGDEQLLYRPANSAFARTPSNLASSVARQGSRGRVSPYDSQLQRAQETLQHQRHKRIITRGRRSSVDANVRASVGGSIVSDGSNSRMGSTIQRSGTRLQLHRATQDTEERLVAPHGSGTLLTPTGDDLAGSGVRGRASSQGTATAAGLPDSASPTPSRVSESSPHPAAGNNTGRLSGGTPLLRRSAGSKDGSVDPVITLHRHTPLASSAGAGAAATHAHPPPHPHSQARGSPSSTLFARPMPRFFSTPSPRGTTGGGGVGPGMVTSFVASSGPYYTNTEELTKLTRVRDDVLRSMLLAASNSSTHPAPVSINASDSNRDGASNSSKEEEGASIATTPPNHSASSTTATTSMHVSRAADPRAGDSNAAAATWTTPPSPGRRQRQRVYGVDIRASVNSEGPVSPQTDVSKLHGRSGALLASSATPILLSSMRQKPSSAAVAAGLGTATGVGSVTVSPSRSPVPGGSTATGSSGAVARPKLDTGALITPITAGVAPAAAATTAARQPRRSTVAVSMSTLQPATAVAERLRRELVHQQTSPAASSAASTIMAPTANEVSKLNGRVATNSSAIPSFPRFSIAGSFDEATCRLLLDPFFPLVSEENYQRLLLQNDEYNERRVMAVRILSASARTQSRLDEEPPQNSASSATQAARALEMDLAEAEEPAGADMPPPLPASTVTDPAATTTTTASRKVDAELEPHALAAPPAFALPAFPSPPPTPPIGAAGGGGATANTITTTATPRRPSVQYGGPTASPVQATSRPRSPSPAAASTSPALGISTVSLSTTSPAREGKLLVNAVMPSEKTGPIKPLPLSGIGYMPTTSADVAPAGSSPSTPVNTSPTRASSLSRSASLASSHHTTRRNSFLYAASQQQQQAALTDATAAAATSPCSSSGDNSTASDETVDRAELTLHKALPRWGPFRTAPTVGPSHKLGRDHIKTNSTTVDDLNASSSLVSAASSNPSCITPLPAPMLAELEAYVHFFLKCFRTSCGGEGDGGSGMRRDVPDTPLALQRAIRHNLRLSTGNAAADGQAAAADADGVATELQDPMDDGSYHSQNVQFILDLIGNLLQLQDSFSEDGSASVQGCGVGSRATAPPRAIKGEAREKEINKTRLTEADFLATVMCHFPAPDEKKTPHHHNPSDTIHKPGMESSVMRVVKKSRKTPLLKLDDPELRAVEMMFVGTGRSNGGDLSNDDSQDIGR